MTYGNNPPGGYEDQPPGGYGGQPPGGYGSPPPGGYGPGGYGNPGGGYANPGGGYGNPAGGYGNPPGGYGSPPPPTDYRDPAGGYAPGGYGNPAGGYANPGYGAPAGGYPPAPGGYGAPMGYGAYAAPGNYASWLQRVGAYLIDVIPVGILDGIGWATRNLGIYALFALVGLGITAYNRWYQAGTTGQSWGKKALGITLISEETGQPIGGGMAFVRDLAHFIDGITCYIGFLFPLWDDKRQTFADKIVRTVVVPA